MTGNSGLAAGIFKPAAANIAIKHVPHVSEVVRMAIPAAMRFARPAPGILLERPIEISGDKQIEEAIAIIVQECGARAPPAGTHASCIGDVDESFAGVIPI